MLLQTLELHDSRAQLRVGEGGIKLHEGTRAIYFVQCENLI